MTRGIWIRLFYALGKHFRALMPDCKVIKLTLLSISIKQEEDYIRYLYKNHESSPLIAHFEEIILANPFNVQLNHAQCLEDRVSIISYYRTD